MDDLTLQEADQVAGAMTLVTSYLVSKIYQATDYMLKDIAQATWGADGIGQMSGFVDAP